MSKRTVSIEIGDIVCLASGGLKMTVESVEGATVGCVWFGRSEKIMRDQFPMSCLKSGGDTIGELLQEIRKEQPDA